MKIMNVFILVLLSVLLTGCEDKRNLAMAEEYLNHLYDLSNYDITEGEPFNLETYGSVVERLREGYGGYHDHFLEDNIGLDMFIMNAKQTGKTFSIIEEKYELGDGIEGTKVVKYNIMIDAVDAYYEFTGQIIFDLDGNIISNARIGGGYYTGN